MAGGTEGTKLQIGDVIKTVGGTSVQVRCTTESSRRFALTDGELSTQKDVLLGQNPISTQEMRFATRERVHASQAQPPQ